MHKRSDNEFKIYSRAIQKNENTCFYFKELLLIFFINPQSKDKLRNCYSWLLVLFISQYFSAIPLLLVKTESCTHADIYTCGLPLSKVLQEHLMIVTKALSPFQ